MRPSGDLTIGGLIAKDWPLGSQARSKRLRESQQNGPTLEMIAAVVRDLADGVRLRDVEEADHAAATVRQQLLQDQRRVDFLDQFKTTLEKSLSSFHDYRQINSQIIQWANVLIEREQGSEFTDKIARVDPVIQSIYQACKFLDEKLTVGSLLLDRSWLLDQRECTSFRVHASVYKYAQIHKARAQNKAIDIKIEGTSTNYVNGNARAAGVVIHTLLDNAVKYSPQVQQVKVTVSDMPEGGVSLKVSSLGPRITEYERERIFELSFRGEKALEFVDEGSGYGLYVSQLIAREHFGTEITVFQQYQRFPGTYETEFAWVIPARAAIL